MTITQAIRQTRADAKAGNIPNCAGQLKPFLGRKPKEYKEDKTTNRAAFCCELLGYERLHAFVFLRLHSGRWESLVRFYVKYDEAVKQGKAPGYLYIGSY